MSVNEILTALADDNRRSIIEILKQGRLNTGDLAKKLEISPQALSYHLKKLKQANLIYETKYKNFIYYELNLSVLDEAIVWINSFMKKG